MDDAYLCLHIFLPKILEGVPSTVVGLYQAVHPTPQNDDASGSIDNNL